MAIEIEVLLFIFLIDLNLNLNITIVLFSYIFILEIQYSYITDVAGKCVVEFDGNQVERNIGETWNSTEVCVKHTCELNDKGEPTEKTFREYCYLSCYNVCLLNTM